MCFKSTTGDNLRKLFYLSLTNRQNLIYKGESVFVCVSPVQKYTRLDQPSPNLVGGLTLQGPGHRLCFGPRGGLPGSGGPKQGLESIATTVRLGKNFIKQKLQGRSVFVGADHIFGPVIWIWKYLGPMSFWSHGQSFSGKFYETKVVVHLPNSKVGQVLTHTPIPLPLPRVGGGQNGLRANLQPQTTHTAAREQSEACMSGGKNCRYPDLTQHTLGLIYLAICPLIIHFITLI